MIKKILFSYKFISFLAFFYLIYYKILFVFTRRKYKTFNVKIKSTGLKFKLKLDITPSLTLSLIDTDYRTDLLRIMGYYEPETSIALRDELKEGDTVMELGSLYGDFTVQASKYVGDNGKVFAFEPVTEEVENSLKPTLELNNCKNVSVYDVALNKEGGAVVIRGIKRNSRPIFPVLKEINPNFIFIDVDADNNLRQEMGIISEIIRYRKETGNRPKVFLEYKGDISEPTKDFSYSKKITGRHYILQF